VIASIAIMLAANALAQTPQFEVASVKLSPDQRGLNVSYHGGPGTDDPGLFSCENCEIWGLIDQAFELKAYELTGPPWMRTTRLIISAKIPPGTTKEQFRLMLQNLLIDRFKLTFHREKKEMPTYDLVVAKNGPKLKESTTPSEPLPASQSKIDADGFPIVPPGPGSGRMAMAGRKTAQRFVDAPMSQLAAQLAGAARRPVHDATGLTGKYDFTLKWVMDWGGPPTADDSPTIFEALQEQLGLKLEPRKSMVDTLVVDHIEKIPTEN
jgi:uncharacterized protein (TIGR03435 family)